MVCCHVFLSGMPKASWPPGPTAPVEISGAIHLHYLADIMPYRDINGVTRSNCIDTVKRAANYHMKWINFFPLLYW
jgi:hypothetical protein